MKTCPSCDAIIKANAKFCSRCGRKLQQDTIFTLSSQEKFDIRFTKERASLERAIQSFDGIFADQTLHPKTNKELWEKKKNWYSNQKKRFLQRNISNEMFYSQLKSLNEYLQSTVRIPEEKLPKKVTSKQYDKAIRRCWTCGKIVPIQSSFLHFCSKTCESNYSPYEIQKKVKPSYVSMPVEISQNIKLDRKESKIEHKLEEEELITTSNHLLSKTEQDSFEPDVAAEPKPFEEAITVTPLIEHASEDIQSLFSPIRYQVQDLLYEQGDTGPLVRIIPYSGSLKEIRVDFNQNQIVMKGCLKRQHLPLINLELKIDGEPRQTSWDDPWHDITLTGEDSILKRIRLRNEIADRLASLGTALVKVESEIKGEICLQLSCNKTQEAIRFAYLLIRDLQLFFEISFY